MKKTFWAKFNDDGLPDIKISNIHFENFKVFDDLYLDFSEQGKLLDFICFVGNNGTGKSTILNSIQMLFNRFDGYSTERVIANLGKHVRHTKDDLSINNNFLITANLQTKMGGYCVKIDKSGFIQDHPPEIKDVAYRLCYLTRLDQELHKFQLNRDKWNIFKKLFEAVTGFVIEEIKSIFDQSDDPIQANILSKYVLGFFVHKPRETILHKECSDGEKKIIKSFSTMLNMEYTPKIILIDNVEMHVDRTRHIRFVQALRECYPHSQIFSTTHSYYLSRQFDKGSKIYDLRTLHENQFIKNEPWRLCIMDEIDDCLTKLHVMKKDQNIINLIQDAQELKELCGMPISDLQLFQIKLKGFLSSVSDNFVCDLFS